MSAVVKQTWRALQGLAATAGFVGAVLILTTWDASYALQSETNAAGRPADAGPDKLDRIYLRSGGTLSGHLKSLDEVAVVRVLRPAGKGEERAQTDRIPRAAISMILLDGKPFPANAREMPALEDAALLDNGKFLTGRVTVANEKLKAGRHAPVPVTTVTLIRLYAPPIIKKKSETGKPLLDELENCVAEVKARHKVIAAFLKRQAATIAQAKVRVDGAALNADTFAKGHLVNQLDGFLKQAKMTREEYKEFLKKQGMEGQFSEDVYRQARRSFAIMGLGQCINTYYLITDDLLRSALKFGMEALFWGEDVHLRLQRFSDEVRTGWVYLDNLAEPERAVQKPPDELATLGSSTSSSPATSKLTRAVDAKFDKIRISADAARHNAESAAIKKFLDGQISNATLEAIKRREKGKWCQKVTAPHRNWAQAAARRMTLAGKRYQPMGTGTIKWAVAEVLRYRDFARRYGKLLPPPGTTTDGEMDTSLMHQVIDTNMGQLIEFFGKGHTRLSNFRLFLKELATWYKEHRTANIERFDDMARHIAETCGSAPMVAPKIPSLKTGKVVALLDAALKGLKPDVNAVIGDMPVCEVDLGQAEQIYSAIGTACAQN